MKKETHLWEKDVDSKSSKNIVRFMRVVTDNAERCVALIEEYNKLNTTNYKQK